MKIMCKWCNMMVERIEESNKGPPHEHEDKCINKVIQEERDAIMSGLYLCDRDTMSKVISKETGLKVTIKEVDRWITSRRCGSG